MFIYIIIHIIYCFFVFTSWFIWFIDDILFWFYLITWWLTGTQQNVPVKYNIYLRWFIFKPKYMNNTYDLSIKLVNKRYFKQTSPSYLFAWWLTWFTVGILWLFIHLHHDLYDLLLFYHYFDLFTPWFMRFIGILSQFLLIYTMIYVIYWLFITILFICTVIHIIYWYFITILMYLHRDLYDWLVFDHYFYLLTPWFVWFIWCLFYFYFIYVYRDLYELYDDYFIFLYLCVSGFIWFICILWQSLFIYIMIYIICWYFITVLFIYTVIYIIYWYSIADFIYLHRDLCDLYEGDFIFVLFMYIVIYLI